MPWQDWVISVGNIVLAAGLIPSVLSKNKPSAWTSLAAGSVLYIFSFTFYTLTLFYSAVVVAVTASIWTILFIQKIRQKS